MYRTGKDPSMETNYEDDDDTHYCIKCHLTIHGLDNYINHRQNGCRPSLVQTKNITTDNVTSAVSYPEILNADAFFSSLELQSSSKIKNISSVKNLIDRDKKITDKLNEEKRKKNKRYQDIDESSPKEKLMTLPPVVTDLDDPTDHIGIPSLVGFPDIVSFTDKSTITKLQSSKSIEEKKIRHEHEEQQNTSSSTSRVWLSSNVLDDLEENNKLPPSPDDVVIDTDDTDYDYQDDDESDDESLADDLGQDDSYSETDDPDDREYISSHHRAHTGGKWKPPEQLLQDMADHNQHDDEIMDQDEYNRDSPAPSGGKWKPIEKADEDELIEDEKMVEMEDKETTNGIMVNSRSNRNQVLLQPPLSPAQPTPPSPPPPPSHTRGKWIPGASVIPLDSTYWCNPCGRKLASKLVYNRHLRSDLHARRSIQEIEGDVKLPKSIGSLLRKKQRSQRRKTLENKQAETKKIMMENDLEKRKRNRQKEVLRCEICHARVRRLQLGKHLLSHYHCRVAGLNPDSSTAQNFILENMANVVRQCPFQCAGCRFYCNTEETFLLHWRSDLHKKLHDHDDATLPVCTCCNVICDNDAAMEEHLLSYEHGETVAMINGSVPIVIRRQRFLACETCDRYFRYNFQLRLHSKETGHPESWTATDDYQQKISCNFCPQILRSQLALQRHQLTCHKIVEESSINSKTSAPYFCSFCSLNFKSSQEAILHRRTTTHKQIVKEHKLGQVAILETECGHCGQLQNNLIEYKQHIFQCHHEFCQKCLKCEKIFALPEDLSLHLKNGECLVESGILKQKCSQCSFSTYSQTELIFHEAIHSGGVEEETEEQHDNNTNEPGCSATPTTSTSTSASIPTDKLFSCSKCLTTFDKKYSLKVHINQCQISLDENEDGNNGKVGAVAAERPRNYTCSECNSSFYTKDNLRKHMLRHTGKNYKCGLPGCPTVLRTATELKVHRAHIHENTTAQRKFHCNYCFYTAKTEALLRRHSARHSTSPSNPLLSCLYKNCRFVTRMRSHLKRHNRLHTGSKPYKCLHCPYASNNIENLRKHILSTRLHPGKTIYECEKCKSQNLKIYGTNYSKELRAHLLDEHSEEFPTPAHANSYVAGIFASDGHSSTT